MEKEIISFIIYSNFGFFKKPDQNSDFFLTYDYIPRPTILGIIGAMIGLTGYDRFSLSNKIEFYEFLKSLRIGVQILEKSKEQPILATDFKNREKDCHKTIVKYNNYHGYGSLEEGGNWILSEQILIEPAYRIFVSQGTCDNKYYLKIKEHLETKQSIYSLYMGKNEFPLSIIYEGTNQYEISSPKDEYIKIETFFPSEFVEELDSFGSTKSQLFWYPCDFINFQYNLRKMIFGDMNLKIKASLINDVNNILAKKKNSDEYVFLF